MPLAPLATERATRLVSGFAGAHVLVVGDAMLDTFIVGAVTRISPEAPVPVVAFRHETHRIGGAANVAHNITALGGHATLIAVIGQDDNAKTLTRGCREAGIEAGYFATDAERVTTTKVRVVTERNQQVARIDYEVDTEIAGEVERGIVSAIRQHGADAAAIVVSDYLKGCVTKPVMTAAVETARQRQIPLLVDPKIPHIEYYAGATVITPNHHEAETATHMRIRSLEEASEAARAFRDRTRCEAVLMTRGDQGMWLLGQCLDERKAQGIACSLPDLLAECASLSAPRALIDIDDPQLILPGHTIDKINSQLVSLGRPAFAADRASLPSLVNTIFHSMAARYAEVLSAISRITGKKLRRLFIVGGGSQNALLNQITGQRTGLEIILGSAESTTIGNFAVQMAALQQDQASSTGVTAKAVAGWAEQIVSRELVQGNVANCS